MIKKHGVSAYRNGCRCNLCRAAWTEARREQRAEGKQARIAAEAAGMVYVAPGITHGRSGYQNHSCRCITCRRAAKRASIHYRRLAASQEAAA